MAESHFAGGVDQVAATVRDLDASGEEYPLLQSGRGSGVNGDGGYAVSETKRALGCIIEAINLPEEMPEPERVFPS